VDSPSRVDDSSAHGIDRITHESQNRGPTPILVSDENRKIEGLTPVSVSLAKFFTKPNYSSSILDELRLAS